MILLADGTILRAPFRGGDDNASDKPAEEFTPLAALNQALQK